MNNSTEFISSPVNGSIELKVRRGHYIPNRLLNICSIAVYLVFLNGCMSYSTLQRAKGEWNVVSGKQAENPEPINYALLPFAVAADVVTLPIQGAIHLMLSQGP